MSGTFKALSRTEKLMIALIAMLLIGICLRWSYIRREAGSALRDRIESIRAAKPQPSVKTSGQAADRPDSAAAHR